MSNHVLKHRQTTAYFCFVCRKTYKSFENLKSHQNEHLGGAEKWVLTDGSHMTDPSRPPNWLDNLPHCGTSLLPYESDEKVCTDEALFSKTIHDKLIGNFSEFL
jgi:hypothetical protein